MLFLGICIGVLLDWALVAFFVLRPLKTALTNSTYVTQQAIAIISTHGPHEPIDVTVPKATREEIPSQ